MTATNDVIFVAGWRGVHVFDQTGAFRTWFRVATFVTAMSPGCELVVSVCEIAFGALAVFMGLRVLGFDGTLLRSIRCEETPQGLAVLQSGLLVIMLLSELQILTPDGRILHRRRVSPSDGPIHNFFAALPPEEKIFSVECGPLQ